MEFPSITELSLNLRDSGFSFKTPQLSSLMMASISSEAIKPIRAIPNIMPLAFVLMSV
jgi:hypothetical protein